MHQQKRQRNHAFHRWCTEIILRYLCASLQGYGRISNRGEGNGALAALRLEGESRGRFCEQHNYFLHLFWLYSLACASTFRFVCHYEYKELLCYIISYGNRENTNVVIWCTKDEVIWCINCIYAHQSAIT